MVSHDIGIGNPALATAEKGKRFAEVVAEKYARFIADFVKVDSPSDLDEPWNED